MQSLSVDQLKNLKERTSRKTSHGERTFYDPQEW